ncbi:MAG: hypothetical protein Q8P91_03245 [bacterium]|nr:hypothetical protein [bacterium]
MKINPAQQFLQHLCICSAVVALLLLSGLNIETFKQKQKVLGLKTENTQEDSIFPIEEIYWTFFLTQNPNYFEGWIELAKLDIDSGKTDHAIYSYTKAKQLNPNSQKVKAFGKLLRLP